MALFNKKPQDAGAVGVPGQAPHKVHAKLRGRMPEKRTINLAAVNVKRIDWHVGAPMLLLVLVAVVAFGKFAVADRISAAAKAQNEVAALHAEINDGYRTIDSFGEINDIYAHYTYSGMTEEELSRVDRVKMMELLERVVLPAAPVDNWSVEGNVMTLEIEGRTLQEINQIMQHLLAEELVDFCTVSTASTNSQKSGSAAVGDDTVTASVVVQFRNIEQEVAP